MWKGQRYRDAVDNVMSRHVDGKSEALQEVERIYDGVREGRFDIKPADPPTVRQLGEVYFDKYLSPQTGRPLGPNERYRWNVMMHTTVDGRPLGDYLASAVKKHHVETFVDANRVVRTETGRDAKGKIYVANRGGVVSTNRAVGRLKAFYNWAVEREYLSDNPAQRVHRLKEFERERRLEPGEEEKLRSVTKDDWLWRLRLVAALETGCRIGELLGVQFKQLRWDLKSCICRTGRRRASKRATSRYRRNCGPCWSCGEMTRPVRRSDRTRMSSATRSASG
jgi:hypothetical protein